MTTDTATKPATDNLDDPIWGTKDIVVWLNLPSHIYHLKGMRWYGATNNGAYVCKDEADKDGNRATRNGQ